MRILHVPYTFHPDPAGGTEVYVDALARAQRELGIETAIAAPGGRNEQYEWSGLPVWRFAVKPDISLDDLYGSGDTVAAQNFNEALDGFRPDLVHLHAMTSAVSVRLAERVKARNIPVVLNYHTPTVSCSRGTLLRWGTDLCDGHIEQKKCAACVLQSHGMNRAAAELFCEVPQGARGAMAGLAPQGSLQTALRMPELIEARVDAFHRMTELTDGVVALCEWSRELLVRNGVPDGKLAVCRQGIAWKESDVRRGVRGAEHRPWRAAFFGRLDETKGAHVVMEALQRLPGLQMELDVYGVRQGAAGNRYNDRLSALAASDARVRLLPAIASEAVVPCLADYDFAVVPSQWLETGPLVVLEAFAAGTPVVGSKLGGIAELVTAGVDGVLVEPYASREAWADALRAVVEDGAMLPRLRRGIRRPRTMAQAALEMNAVYEGLARAKRVA